ncbi:hypothetical protein COY16_03755 [Candidatus Roizmanbacteria bacterium CG_4_10_14_0_2_um_filter_39_13]|uniref:N-acetyltransferase domain-containing protein n=1 Tax=Candidatus Roizmanbacteria bacterium CG_4_10_14_0_2_um_filter_39_13 TaxID=1974825 RepID=A0A2M7TYB8_9BACT|nr:MAG: hypothetical protein COY16_03755 [Candidatus Roizmanbacteria bacterium CG_4_10_14_0_2_um_filter_39_13]
MSEFHIDLYSDKSRVDIITLMREFGDYTESIDDIKRTEYKKGGAEYFTDKMIREAQEYNGAVFVAHIDDEVVGFIGGYVGKQDKDEEMEAVPLSPGIMSEFFVTAKSRGKHIGEKLFKTLKRYLKNKGCDVLRLEVFASNILARDFYTKHGFTERLITLSKTLK